MLASLQRSLQGCLRSRRAYGQIPEFFQRSLSARVRESRFAKAQRLRSQESLPYDCLLRRVPESSMGRSLFQVASLGEDPREARYDSWELKFDEEIIYFNL
jgi:hypothetical protein